MGKVMGDKRVVGRCSLCGGIVSVPLVFWSVTLPVPQCETCGAYADQTQNLPVVPMTPRKPMVGPKPWEGRISKANPVFDKTLTPESRLPNQHMWFVMSGGRYVGREC